MNQYDVLQSPIVTEKAEISGERKNSVFFKVQLTANKRQIKEAVEKIFDVRVTGVRTMINPGKRKRFGRGLGKARKWKKAIVDLREGDAIEFFEGV